MDQQPKFFEDVTFVILNGPTYSKNDRPPFWHNETILVIEGTSLANPPNMELAPLADFPLIEDFEVLLEDMIVSGQSAFGYGIRFYSPPRGFIAGFAWFDHAERELIKENFQIPFGDFNQPFYDLEEGWEIVIAANGDFVYVLQGDFEAPEYYAWFKVNKDVYLAAWQKAIADCKAAFQR